MNPGKTICEVLKGIRKKIADANGIPYEIRECHFGGNCVGTCPACENELAYIQRQLSLRRRAGKKIALLGLCSSLMATPAFGQQGINGTVIDSNEADTTVIDGGDLYPEVSPEVIGYGMIKKHVITGSIVNELDPRFPGGEDALDDYIASHLECPEELRHGTVTVKITVRKNGKLRRIRVQPSGSSERDAALRKLFREMPRWEPAMKRKDFGYKKYKKRIPVEIDLDVLQVI